MTVRRIVPDLQAEDPAASRAFYGGLLGLDLAMDMGWVLTFTVRGQPAAQVTVMQRDRTAAAQPEVSVEVDDVDAVYEEAQRRGYEVVHSLTDEPWGVRRFFVRDPAGHVVNILSHSG